MDRSMAERSSDKAEQKVTQIISRGAAPDILDDGYERRWAIGALKDYASHPRSADIVVERAEAAIEQLSDETSEEGDDE
jgi:hypothetical protein